MGFKWICNGFSQDSNAQKESSMLSPVMDARNNILSVMPRIMACLTSLWRAVNIVDKQDDWCSVTIGAPKVCKLSMAIDLWLY